MINVDTRIPRVILNTSKISVDKFPPPTFADCRAFGRGRPHDARSATFVRCRYSPSPSQARFARAGEAQAVARRERKQKGRTSRRALIVQNGTKTIQRLL